jgi:hypothetical protein
MDIDEPSGLEASESEPPGAPAAAPAPTPSAGTLTRQALDLYAANLARLVVIGAIGYIPLAIVPFWPGTGGQLLGSLLGSLGGVLSGLAQIVAAAVLVQGGRPGILASQVGAVRRLAGYLLMALLLGLAAFGLFIVVLFGFVVLGAGIAVVAKVSTLLAGLLGVVLMLGTVVAVVVGIALLFGIEVRLSLATALLVLERASVREAINESARRTHGRVLRLLGAYVATGFVGVLPYLGGVLVATYMVQAPVLTAALIGLFAANLGALTSSMAAVAWHALKPIPAPEPVADHLAPEPTEEAVSSAAGLAEAPLAEALAVPARKRGRGGAAALLSIVLGVVLLVAGSAALASRLSSLVSNTTSGVIVFGTDRSGDTCSVVGAKSTFRQGERVYWGAFLTRTIPVGGRIRNVVLVDGREAFSEVGEPATTPYGCIYGADDSTGLDPGRYTLRFTYLEVMIAEGSFMVAP